MKLIRRDEVLAIVPVSSATLYRMVRRKEFPAPKKIGNHLSAWDQEEVERWAKNPSGYSRKSSKRDLSGFI